MNCYFNINIKYDGFWGGFSNQIESGVGLGPILGPT